MDGARRPRLAGREALPEDALRSESAGGSGQAARDAAPDGARHAASSGTGDGRYLPAPLAGL